LPIFQDKTA